MAKPTTRCVQFLLRHSGVVGAPPNAISPRTLLRAIALAPPHGSLLPPRWRPAFVPTRPNTTTASSGGYSPQSDPSPNMDERHPKENIPFEGCDYEHWLVVMKFPEGGNKPSEKNMINTYIKTLAAVVGSEKEAKKKIYSVCTSTYTGFGALISKELSSKLKDLPRVLCVLPDSYFDVTNKDYGGDLFVHGKVIHRQQFLSTKAWNALVRREKNSTGNPVSMEKKTSIMKAVSKMEKPSTTETVSSKEKPSIVKTGSKKEKKLIVKTLSEGKKTPTGKTVSKKKKPRP